MSIRENWNRLLNPVTLLVVILVLLGHNVNAQQSFDSVMLRSLKANTVSFSSLVKNDTVILICFWNSQSEAGINELNAIQKNYSRWQSLASFKLLAISTDEGKDMSKVRPITNMNGWLFEVYIDFNGDLRKALKVTNIPESLILKGREIIYRQSGYQPGTENYLLDKIRTIH